MGTSRKAGQRVMTMLALIIAGEAIFGLPFAVARYFGPTFLKVFEFNDEQLGWLFAYYGTVAMAAYLLGGPLADAFTARKLLTFALVSTGACGLFMLRIPDYQAMQGLFALWGATTILPFWAALIKATREWGGSEDQCTAFGILDGGRGLLAAVLSSIATFFFWLSMPADPSAATPSEELAAFRVVVMMYIAACMGAAALVWLFIPEPKGDQQGGTEQSSSQVGGNLIARVFSALGTPIVWLHAVIIICAYCAFKGSDFFSRYAVAVYGLNSVQAAFIVTLTTWIRPVSAVAAGFVADRVFSASSVILVCFALLVGVFSCLAITTPTATMATVAVLWINVTISSVAVFAHRGVYFALLEEANIPNNVTGTAVGVVSFIGYTPDIFVSLVGGMLITRLGSTQGYQVFFGGVAGVALLGLATSLVFRVVNHRKQDKQ